MLRTAAWFSVGLTRISSFVEWIDQNKSSTVESLSVVSKIVYIQLKLNVVFILPIHFENRSSDVKQDFDKKFTKN